MASQAATGLDTPMWLAHHHVSERHKCMTIAGRHVCRRCAVLYPLTLIVAVARLAGVLPEAMDVWVMWLAPIPLVIDWVVEHLGCAQHSPRRQAGVTALAAWPFGIALARHAVDPFETHATAAILIYGLICLSSWLVKVYRQMPEEMPGWQEDFERDEAEREARLRSMVGLD